MRPVRIIPASMLCLFIACLALLPFLDVRVTAQTARQERLVSRLPKHMWGATWIKGDTILATVGTIPGIGEAALVNLATGELRIIANGVCASPSPDGMKMAWIPGPGSVGDIWILDMQNLVRRQLTTVLSVAAAGGAESGCLAWSPDGRHIAAVTVRAGAYFAGTHDISIVAADNGRTENLITAEDLLFDSPAWTPDSRRLAVAVSRQGEGVYYNLWVVSRVDVFDLGSRQTTTLVNPKRDDGRPYDLAVSPDGRTLLFVFGGQIFAYNGMSIERIASGHSPMWRPDGKAILFARELDEPAYRSPTSLFMVDY